MIVKRFFRFLALLGVIVGIVGCIIDPFDAQTEVVYTNGSILICDSSLTVYTTQMTCYQKNWVKTTIPWKEVTALRRHIPPSGPSK